jgi:L-lactate dehydrogenase complex protein LldG
MANSRDLVLQRIRNGLAGTAGAADLPGGAAPPPVPPVWPRETSDPAVLAERFTSELKEVHGEVFRCGSMQEARQKLAALLDEIEPDAQRSEQGGQSGEAASPNPLGSMDKPPCREVAEGLVPDRVVWAERAWGPDFMARLPAGLVAAEYLLADTGSVVIACGTHQERLLCYLPPVCIVIARVEQLFEHLPAAWEAMVRRCADPQLRGELVIVTGPSRTADIEKILILGVHGPKRLVVILVG